MALINCSECGKEISDKAVSCPNCGNPVNQQNKEPEEYLVCPKCSSRELHSEKSGFSGKKAVAGAVLTGGIGLLAGTIGSKDIQITCLKCGNRFKAGEARVVKEGVSTNIDTIIVEKYRSTGSIIQCVQLYKDETGAGIADAKRIVENILDKNSIDWRERTNSGCMVVILIFMAVGSLLFLM